VTQLERTAIYPATHYLTRRATIEEVVPEIRAELEGQLAKIRREGRRWEAQHPDTRTNFDVEMVLEIGTCPGIENYARYIAQRLPGERPACLFDYFPEDFLLVVDESHVWVPQINGMYNGDQSRKSTLVDHGF